MEELFAIIGMKPTPVTQGVEEESESDDDYGPETAPQ